VEPSEYDNIARLEETHWWYTGMAAVAAGWLRRLPAPLDRPRTRSILDAGCGTGGALGWLAEFGCPAGVDIHPRALRLAAAKGRRQLAQASIEWLPFPANSFDLLTSLEVLYHLQVADDVQALREFARVLRPGGWLLLRLPAHEWLRRAHDRVVHTRHRYTRAEVRHKLQAASLRPVRVTYANSLMLGPALAWRLAHGQREEAPASDVRLPPRPINYLLAALLRAEGRWLAHFDLPLGMSVLALARKEL
jgi:SAM-dependent methyltransferase